MVTRRLFRRNFYVVNNNKQFINKSYRPETLKSPIKTGIRIRECYTENRRGSPCHQVLPQILKPGGCGKKTDPGRREEYYTVNRSMVNGIVRISFRQSVEDGTLQNDGQFITPFLQEVFIYLLSIIYNSQVIHAPWFGS